MVSALHIIAVEGTKINFILNTSTTKAYWPFQLHYLLAPLTSAYSLDLCPPSEGLKVLGVPIGSRAFVTAHVERKLASIGDSLALAAKIPDGRIAHNIHRVTASTCRMTHLLRLILTADATAQWRDFDERQRKWLESISNAPASPAIRRQARLPRSLAGLSIPSAADIASCAYISSLLQSAAVRADGRRHAPLKTDILDTEKPLLEALQSSTTGTKTSFTD